MSLEQPLQIREILSAYRRVQRAGVIQKAGSILPNYIFLSDCQSDTSSITSMLFREMEKYEFRSFSSAPQLLQLSVEKSQDAYLAIEKIIFGAVISNDFNGMVGLSIGSQVNLNDEAMQALLQFMRKNARNIVFCIFLDSQRPQNQIDAFAAHLRSFERGLRIAVLNPPLSSNLLAEAGTIFDKAGVSLTETARQELSLAFEQLSAVSRLHYSALAHLVANDLMYTLLERDEGFAVTKTITKKDVQFYTHQQNMTDFVAENQIGFRYLEPTRGR